MLIITSNVLRRGPKHSERYFDMKTKIFIIVGLVTLGACSTGKQLGSQDVEYEEDRVLGRSDGLSSRPDWARETISVFEKDGKVQFIGLSEVPGDSRSIAAFKLSDAAARGGVATKLETSVFKLVESSDTGLGLNEQQLKSLIREVSSVNLKNVDVKSRYWEKLQRTNSDGQKILVMKVFSLIEIDKEALRKMMVEKARNAAVPADVRNKVEDMIRSQWDPENI